MLGVVVVVFMGILRSVFDKVGTAPASISTLAGGATGRQAVPGVGIDPVPVKGGQLRTPSATQRQVSYELLIGQIEAYRAEDEKRTGEQLPWGDWQIVKCDPAL